MQVSKHKHRPSKGEARPAPKTYEKIQPSTQAGNAMRPLSRRSAKRDRQMTKTSGSNSEGKYRVKASSDTASVYTYRWTSLVRSRETTIMENQNGMMARNMFTGNQKQQKEREKERKKKKKRKENRIGIMNHNREKRGVRKAEGGKKGNKKEIKKKMRERDV